MSLKYLLFLSVSLISIELSSQCTPDDCSADLPPYGGICDDALIDGFVNMDYDDYESFVLTDVCFNAQEIDPGNPDITIQIETIQGFSFSGLPAGLTAETNEPDYSSSGGMALGCIAVEGVPEEAGLFAASADFTASVNAFPLGGCPGGLAFPQDQPSNYALSLLILPDASFEGLEEEYCENDGDVQLIITGTTGGEFSGPGVSGDMFSPSDAGPGSHTITYTVSAQEGDAIGPAENSSSFELEVLELIEYFADEDGDGFGNPDESIEDCEQPDGYVEDDEDCDDTNEDINPDADEICDGLDNNCDGDIDEDFDEDNDGFTTCQGDCDDDNNDVYPDAEEICDGLDNNCDGDIDEDFDEDNDGYTSCGEDCDDTNADINPDAEEICDGIDNNCDGEIDEGFDMDNDGFTSCAGDCDDTNPLINPMAIDTCGMDNNCDGLFPDTVFENISFGLCAGDTIIYENDTITELGIYTITLTAENGCDSVVTLEITDASVMPTIAIEVDSICTTDPPIELGNLTSPGGGIFEGPGIEGDTFNPELAGIGDFTITYTVTNGECEESVDFDLSVVECTSSILDTPLEQALNVYPNPTNDQLYIEIEEYTGDIAKLSVFDINGRRVQVDVQAIIPGQYYVCRTNNLQAGLYLLKIDTNLGLTTRRVFVE